MSNYLSSNDLPESLSNLISQYQDQKAYLEQPSNLNSRSELLNTELQNIPTKSILKYKLAYDLAENYLNIKQNMFHKFLGVDLVMSKSPRNPDLDTIAGIFLIFLQSYQYKDLLDPNHAYPVLDEVIGIDYASVWGLINHKIIEQENLIFKQLTTDTFFGMDFNMPLDQLKDNMISETIREMIRKLKIEEGIDAGDYEKHVVFCRQIYYQILNLNKDMKTTISWKEYTKEYIEFLKGKIG